MNESINSDVTKQAFDDFVDSTQAYLDSVVIDGSDQELFIASYLTGHFSLVGSNALGLDDFSLETLNTYMLKSLEKAYAKNEVLGQDQIEVSALWQQLFSRAE
ncbi:YfcL family protein [Paraglaciecola sp. L1A13]|uniref:YfcL family protein n=1 Tax=Paraglaciecola sp. L1A13 TaxID=2686359 RepID=UPI00131B8AD5|nr:YfcL family protein [Paraglaciecola sp. L1A13]